MSGIIESSFLAILGLPGGAEWIVLLVLGLLIFGRRLPEVGKSLGRSIVEFKRGVKGITDEIDNESSHAASSPAQLSEKQGASAPTRSADESVTKVPSARSDSGDA